MDIIYIFIFYNIYILFLWKVLVNGKYVFCEKFIILNSIEFKEVIDLVEINYVVLVEVMIIFYMLIYC